MTNSKIRTYSELIKMENIQDRYEYLRLDSSVGRATFGYDRWLNQQFYKSDEWKRVRDRIILRDEGNDLGVKGFEIHGKVLIHHMNPIEKRDIVDVTEWLLNPEYLICVSHDMHNAIHYRTAMPYGYVLEERQANDTCPWRR